jgi:hypothetical protein
VLTKAVFKNRFIKHMTKIAGKFENYFEFAAVAAWDMYKEDPKDMTPEDHAREGVEEWFRQR